MPFEFEHPNNKGMLLHGQTRCHNGKLVPRGDGEGEKCAALCSPVGDFQKPKDKPGVRPVAAKGTKKENVSANLHVALEASVEELMGCQPCGCTMKWSCCNACAGACRIWSESGFLKTTGFDPEAVGFVSWDGCTDIPEDRVLPAVDLRAKIGARLAHLDVGRGKITAIKITPDATKLVVGCADGSASAYEIDPLRNDLGATLLGTAFPDKPKPVQTKPKPNRGQETTAALEHRLNKRGKRLCDDSDSDTEEDAPKKEQTAETFTPGGHTGPVTCVAVSPDSRSLFTGSRDHTVKQWSLPDLTLVRTFAQKDEGERDDVLALLVSADGETLYSAGEDTCLSMWNISKGERIGKIFQGRVSGKGKHETEPTVDDNEREDDDTDDDVVKVGPSAEEVAAEEEARRKKSINTKAKGTPNWIQCLAFAPDRPSLVFTGSRDCAVRRWNVDERKCERVIPGHTASVTALAMSADGSELVSGGGLGDGTLRHFRWVDFAASGATQEWEDGKPKFTGGMYTRVRSLTGDGKKGGPAHPGGVAAIAISSDERFVYSAGATEGALKQWSAETGEMLTCVPRAHPGGVTSMALLPEATGASGVMGAAAEAAMVATAAAVAAGGRLVTAGADGKVSVWAVDPHDAVAGATLSAQIAQREASLAATEHQRKQLRDAARVPELSRPQMAAKARKDLPAIEKAKYPVNPETGEVKELEDMSVKDLEPLTAAELITVCLANGLLCVDPKNPPPTRQDIAQKMVAFFEEEKEKSRVKAREKRMAARMGPKLNVLG